MPMAARIFCQLLRSPNSSSAAYLKIKRADRFGPPVELFYFPKITCAK
jgi:hypothetical protein